MPLHCFDNCGFTISSKKPWKPTLSDTPVAVTQDTTERLLLQLTHFKILNPGKYCKIKLKQPPKNVPYWSYIDWCRYKANINWIHICVSSLVPLSVVIFSEICFSLLSIWSCIGCIDIVEVSRLARALRANQIKKLGYQINQSSLKFGRF